jgi:hypothetical protein
MDHGAAGTSPTVAALGLELQRVTRGSGVGAKKLSKLTDVPRTAIDNWRSGTVRRPHDWRPLLQIAHVLSLSAEETDAPLYLSNVETRRCMRRRVPRACGAGDGCRALRPL